MPPAPSWSTADGRASCTDAVAGSAARVDSAVPPRDRLQVRGAPLMAKELPLRQRLSLLAIRSGLRALGAVSVTASARAAGELFLRPPPPPLARNVAGEGHRVELPT